MGDGDFTALLGKSDRWPHFVFCHLHMSELYLPSGITLLNKQAKPGKGKCQTEGFRRRPRCLCEVCVNEMLVNKIPRVGMCQRIVSEFRVEIVGYCTHHH